MWPVVLLKYLSVSIYMDTDYIYIYINISLHIYICFSREFCLIYPIGQTFKYLKKAFMLYPIMLGPEMV